LLDLILRTLHAKPSTNGHSGVGSSHARLRLRCVAVSSRTRAVYCSTSLPTGGARKTFQSRHVAGSAQICTSATCAIGGRERGSSRCRRRSATSQRASNSDQGSALNGISLQERLEHRRLLQITCDDAFDLPVPHQKYAFGVVKAAQARGDVEVLVERKWRRALRAHLRADVAAHLGTVRAALVSALRSRATSSPDLASLRRT
jgi:hypothetical protein